MKQTIEFYYSLKIDEINVDGDSYYFYLNGNLYYFVFCNRHESEINEIILRSQEMKIKNISCHDILLNNQNKPITAVDDVFYILLKVKNKNKEYSIIDILDYNKKLRLNNDKRYLYNNRWSTLWKNKIDYIENQLNEIKYDKIIMLSIDYYIGLTENAIYYVESIAEKYPMSELDNIVLSHRRIYYPNYSLNYDNPLSYIFDLEVRDVAEYIKSSFFANSDAFLELQTYLKSVRLTLYSYNMLFARLLYPSYYWDLYEDIVNKNKSSEKLINVISKVNDYEDFIKKAYKEISLYAKLESIDWLIY